MKQKNAEGYGSDATTIANDGLCNTAEHESPYNTDCNDSNPNVYPGAVEMPGNMIDEDCNGYINCFEDSDNDEYGSIQILVNVVTATFGIGDACNAHFFQGDFDKDCDVDAEDLFNFSEEYGSIGSP